MAEWSNAAVLKTVDLHGSGGSNPSLSARNLENQGFAKLVHENVHETPQISMLGAFFVLESRVHPCTRLYTKKWPPTAAIFPQKCGRWYFKIAVGREKPAKPRPVETPNAVHRPRCTLTEHVDKTLQMSIIPAKTGQVHPFWRHPFLVHPDFHPSCH